MNFTLIGLSLSTLICIIAIQLLRSLSPKLDLIDRPNNRKLHKGAIPLIGGVSMFIGFAVGQIYLSFYSDKLTLLFLFSSFIVVAIGVLDDYMGLSVLLRFFFQFTAAGLLIIYGDVAIVNIGNLLGFGEIHLDALSFLITILAILGAVNSLNMIDGIDGLAGMLSLLVFLSIAFLSFNKSSPQLLYSLLFCSVTIPFIFSNLNILNKKNKKIFMGDAGSMFLGLGVSLLLISSSQGDNQVIKPVTALWFFAIPIIDTLSVIIKRAINGQSLFNPDRNHLHHILMRLGFSQKQTLTLIVICASIMVSLGIYSENNQVPEKIMFVSFLIVFLVYFIGMRLIEKK